MTQAVAWNGKFKDIDALGYNLAAITYDPVAALSRFAKIRRIGYTLLADPESRLIRSFGLLNEDFPQGSYAYGVSHAMILVLNADGVVTHRFSSNDHYSLPGVDDVLSILRAAANS